MILPMVWLFCEAFQVFFITPSSFLNAGINIGAENKEIAVTCAACKILSGERNPPMGILKNVPKMVEFLCHVCK